MKKLTLLALVLTAGLSAQANEAVRHQLAMLPYFGVFDDLSYSVNGGEVTLTGSVVRPTLKSDAENVVRRVAGVNHVINNIEVLPVSMFDDRTRLALARAVYGDSVLGTRYGLGSQPAIHIVVKNGNARLEGVVLNEMDRTIAGMRANGVPGVFSLENDLRLEAGR